MPDLVVIIVNWNTEGLIRDCLNTLIPEIKDLNNEIWVVDNNSSDNSVDMLQREFPQVQLVRNTENVGFARANNQILNTIKGQYYLLLNTDTIVPEGSIRQLVAFMENNPHAGAVGPKLKNSLDVVERPLKPLPSIPGELRYCLSLHFFPFNALFNFIFSFRRARWEEITQPAESPVLSAACLIVRGEVVERIGGLSEEYFLFCEENDFFNRMRETGFKGYYLPGVEVIHLIGMSRKRRSPIDSELNFFRSRKLYFKKYHSRNFPLFLMIYYFFFGWSHLMARITAFLKGKSNSTSVMMYRQLWQTLRDRIK